MPIIIKLDRMVTNIEKLLQMLLEPLATWS